MSIKNVVIVGGGTAGWATALLAHKYLPDATISLVESKEIGILGAGEGTTPNFISFLDEVNIPVSDLIKHTGATIKNAIKFTNWNGDGKHYYHGFLVDHPALSNLTATDLMDEYELSSLISVADEVPFEDYNFMTKICEKNRVPQVLRVDAHNSFSNPIFKFNRLANFSVHFDAVKVAGYLKTIALSRGVLHIEGLVKEIKSSKSGDITSLVLESKKVLKTDFVFDCSGFHRLIIGKHFKSEWISYKDYLPVDCAVPFFLDKEEDIPPYTEAIAMKYGWMWKIPLQERYGCGYVFDSSLISEEEATKEIEEYLGFTPHYPRADKGGFKFDAGCFKTPWINNCLAVGLSAGFIEPLEATSVFASLVYVRKALNNLSEIYNRKQKYIDRYNDEVLKYTDDIFNFVYFHYLGKRNDTVFWHRFKEESNYPQPVKDMVNLFKNYVPRKSDFRGYGAFALFSWLSVAYGLNLVNKELFKQMSHDNKYKETFKKEFDVWQLNIQNASSDCMKHSVFLNVMKA